MVADSEDTMEQAGQTTQDAPSPAANTHTASQHDPKNGAPRQPDYDPDWDWYLNEAPALLGERSVQTSIEASLRGGGASGSGVSDNGPYHDAAIRSSHMVPKYRRLHAAWSRLDRASHRVLLARYTLRKHWSEDLRKGPSVDEATYRPDPCVVALGHLVGVAMALARDPDKLREACRNSTGKKNKPVVDAALKRARDAVTAAHRLGAEAKRAVSPGVQRIRESLP